MLILSIILLITNFFRKTNSKLYLTCSQIIENFPNHFCISENKFKEGGFGIIFQVSNTTHTKIVKTSSIDTESKIRRAAIEEFILKIAKHQNIITIENVVKDNLYQHLLLEYAEKGTLEEFLQNGSKNNKSDVELLHLFLKIINGVEHVHSFGYIHSDLKSSNIVFSQSFEPKIIDFERAVKKRSIQKWRGSSVYVEPNFLLHPNSDAYYDETVDVYSLGIILYEMMNNGELPFWELRHENHVKSHLNYGFYKISAGMRLDVAKIIHSCLLIDRRLRPNIKELKADVIKAINRKNVRLVDKDVDFSNKDSFVFDFLDDQISYFQE